MVHYTLKALVRNTAFCGCVMSSLFNACATDDGALERGSNAEELIDCLVPGQIRELDENVTYATKRQFVQLTREECRARGGEEK